MGFQQGFWVNINILFLDIYCNYLASQAGMERNIERLSSGLRINKAADDSAGLSISNRMDNQVRGLQQANRNAQQGNNLLQTAEGGLNEISSILGRMRELAVQAASDTSAATDRDSLNLEVGQLKNEITRIAQSTEYNGLTLLTGSYDGATATEALTLQIGADNAATNQLEIQLGDFQVNSETFGKTDTVNTTAIDASSATFLDVDTLSNAQATITNLDTMIDAVNNARGEIGASQNRLEFASSNLMNSVQNNAASMSTIRDADFAAEAADLAKNQILVQSGTSMLAQANGLSQNVLALIR